MSSTLSAVLAATTGLDGRAEAVYSTPPHQPWTIERMAATGTSSTGAPELRVYRNGVLVDSTGGANNDTSESNGIPLQAGDQVRAAWEACSPGAQMTLVIEGTGA